MQITKITSKEDWDKAVTAVSGSVFLQLSDWPVVSGSSTTWRLGVFDGQKRFLGGVQLLTVKAMFWQYLYSPRGPIFADGLSDKQKEQIFEAIKRQIQEDQTFSKFIFWRSEPNLANTAWQKFASKQGFHPSIALQPAKTLVLDLQQPAETLLAAMHQKTRYNIRLSGKKGVTCRQAGLEEFDKFWALMCQTGQRDKFGIHGKEHYAKMLETAPNIFRLYVAEYYDQVLAGGIFSFVGDTVTYIHGASSNEHRELMAPYCLHWQIINQAQAEGYHYYDLFGVDKDKWPGVTRFKEGFGGQEFIYPGTIDLVLNKGYYKLYKFLRKLRRLF